MTSALIVVDVQRDFCEGGSLAVTGGLEVANKISSSPHWGDYDFHVATMDWHTDGISNGGHFDEWPHHCLAFTEGAAFAAPIRPSRFDAIFLKGQGAPAFSGFQGREQGSGVDLHTWLQSHGVTLVHVVGLAFDYCVKATALDAAQRLYHTTVIKEWTASVFPENDGVVAQELSRVAVEIK